jgi:hypothetical protein
MRAIGIFLAGALLPLLSSQVIAAPDIAAAYEGAGAKKRTIHALIQNSKHNVYARITTRRRGKCKRYQMLMKPSDMDRRISRETCVGLGGDVNASAKKGSKKKKYTLSGRGRAGVKHCVFSDPGDRSTFYVEFSKSSDRELNFQVVTLDNRDRVRAASGWVPTGRSSNGCSRDWGDRGGAKASIRVSRLEGKLRAGDKSRVTVRGEGLPNTLAFWVGHCAGMRRVRSGSTSQVFECRPPDRVGTLEFVIKDRPGGSILKKGRLPVHKAKSSSGVKRVRKQKKTTGVRRR